MKRSSKILSGLILLTLMLVFTVMTATAGTTSDGRFNFDYNSNTGEVMITQYLGNETSVTIPNYISGKPVTSLNGGCFINNKTVKRIQFETGSKVRTIGEIAFAYCENLESISLPSSLRDLGSGTFCGCSSLMGIVIPEGVTAIESNRYACAHSGMFANCTSLTSVTIPSTVTTIGYQAFLGCTSLRKISLPAGLERLGDRCFYGSGLTEISIPTGITEVPGGLCAECISLTRVVMPSVIEAIGGGAFYNCQQLASVNIPIDMGRIERNAFYGCVSLRTLKFGDNIYALRDGIFANCSNLLTVEVVEGSLMEGYCINNNVNYHVYASAIGGAQIEGIEDKTYTGSAIKQNMTLTCRGNRLIEGTHYLTQYSDNVNAGTATVKIIGIGNYVGTIEKKFTINKGDLSKAKIKVSKTKLVYNSEYQSPAVKVYVNGKIVNDVDYYVSYYNNRYVGTATITVSGSNNYQNSTTTTFSIVPKSTKITRLSKGSRSITVKWRKNDIQTTGYQIQYAKNSKFTSGKKTKRITSNSIVSKKITRLTAGKTYYFRIRTYHKVGGKKYYSAWSRVKSVKVRK